jgi:hypothetical protein
MTNSVKSYTLQPDEKATSVMIGTSDMLVWGDLITKSHLRLGGFLNTMAESFVTLHEPKILFLSPVEQNAPEKRSSIHIKLEEILLFYSMGENEPLPPETDVRKYEPMEMVLASFKIECSMLKSPITPLFNALLVSKDAYMPVYKATIHHVANPWLGTFSTEVLQVKLGRLSVVID